MLRLDAGSIILPPAQPPVREMPHGAEIKRRLAMVESSLSANRARHTEQMEALQRLKERQELMEEKVSACLERAQRLNDRAEQWDEGHKALAEMHLPPSKGWWCRFWRAFLLGLE